MSVRNAFLEEKLSRLLAEALKQWGQSTSSEDPCLFAAKAYLLLKEDVPKEAERFNGLLHLLTRERAAAPEPPTGSHLDVRALTPAERHTLIFETWERLAPGGAFTLVNDHDPKPLYYQFSAEHPGAFTWDAVESGPEVWRVAIGKPRH